MNRWHPPEVKTPSFLRAPAPQPAGPPLALEMQIRALREALDRAARVGENALAEAKTLREALLCERLRHTELKTRHKELERFHNATTVGEAETLQKENRRLRTMLAEASIDRGKLLEEFRARAPFERFEPAVPEEEPGVSFESPEPAPCRSGGTDHRQRASRK